MTSQPELRPKLRASYTGAIALALLFAGGLLSWVRAASHVLESAVLGAVNAAMRQGFRDQEPLATHAVSWQYVVANVVIGALCVATAYRAARWLYETPPAETPEAQPAGPLD